MKKITSCELCGKNEFENFYRINDKALGINKFFYLIRCRKCNLIFINPLPSFEDLKRHYGKEYYSLGKIRVEKDSAKIKFRIFLYDLYFNPKNKNYIGKIIFYPFIPYLRGTKIMPGKNLLDVGSGSGQFLYEMRKFGIKAYGCEPGDFDKESSKEHGLEIKNKDLTSSRYGKDSFDLITMNQVLEHTPNPEETIRELKKILKKNGLLILGVPNTNSLAHKIFREDWYQLDVPRHLFNFSSKNLPEKLKEEGFKILRIRYISRPTQFTKSLRYKKKTFMNRKRELIMGAVFLPLTYLCNIFKIGDSIEIWCTK